MSHVRATLVARDDSKTLAGDNVKPKIQALGQDVVLYAKVQNARRGNSDLARLEFPRSEKGSKERGKEREREKK